MPWKGLRHSKGVISFLGNFLIGSAHKLVLLLNILLQILTTAFYLVLMNA